MKNPRIVGGKLTKPKISFIMPKNGCKNYIRTPMSFTLETTDSINSIKGIVTCYERAIKHGYNKKHLMYMIPDFPSTYNPFQFDFVVFQHKNYVSKELRKKAARMTKVMTGMITYSK